LHAALADKKIITSIASQLTVLENRKKRLRHRGVNSAKILKVSGTAAREGEKSVTLNILAVYNEFIDMFIEKTGINALLKH
jgi:hypothetical protein